MSFVLYDLIFLAIFVLITVFFLYSKRSNLKRQGILFLYHTKFGLKIIESTTKRFKKILKPLQYIVIVSGYALMALMLWMILRFSYFYLTSPTIAKELKIPVLLPLFPYLPDLFKVDFLPPFYFTYWIIIIAIIAIPHEFFHGIFARLNNIKVHSTGFGFLGPFLAAFVEPDEKQMAKRGKFVQLSVLGAGTFANVLLTIIFAIILWFFFIVSFSPTGVYFDGYTISVISTSSINSINGFPVTSPENLSQLTNINSTFINITSDNKVYHTTPEIVKASLSNNLNLIGAYDDSPAFKAQLNGAITSVDNVKIRSYQELVQEIQSHSPGDEVQIQTYTLEGIKNYNITLDDRNGSAFLGISRRNINLQGRGLLSSFSQNFYKIIDPLKYNQYFNGLLFKSNIGDFGIFIYDLLWWLVLINLSLALVNMLPVGIFDGGRFFYLTVLAITKNKKFSENAFKFSTGFLLLIILLLMVKWVFAVI